MIVIRTKLNVVPEKQMEVLQTLRSLIVAVREETGCISYSSFCDINNKNQFTLLAEWETQKDLKHHLKSIRFGVLLGTEPLLCEPPKIQISTVSRIQGMEFIETVRNKETL